MQGRPLFPMAPVAGHSTEAEEDDAGDWVYLTEADLNADLLESEESAEALKLGHGSDTSGERLRQALRRGVAAETSAFDVDAFFAAPRALQGIAAELQEVLADLEALRHEAATLIGSIAHGPWEPPAPAASGGRIWVGRPAEEVFGIGALPVRPPELELNLLTQASSLNDYQRKLESLPRILFVERKLRLCMKEVDKYQDGKDISRDELVVNGRPTSGAQRGYAAAVEAIGDALRAAVLSVGAPMWQPEATERAAQLLLGVLNRTSSGFAAFEEVLRLFDCVDVVVVSPESAAARPLEVAAVRGCVLGRAHTRYAVWRADGSGDAPLAVVDAEFAFRLPAALLGRLTAQPAHGQAWPAEELPAAILLRWA